MVRLKPLAFGIATFFPGAGRLLGRRTGGTVSARYCYSVWLRHLVVAHGHGLPINPKVVAELGPGESLGIGLAALISGSERYLAFDVVRLARAVRNLRIFDELVTLFRTKAPIPGNEEFPGIQPKLDCYDFPSSILNEQRLERALDHARLEDIRRSVAGPSDSQSHIQYMVPWHDSSCLQANSVDMIYSQAVLEHVDDVEQTYRAMYVWLKPGGFMSHQIDFRSHGTMRHWDGHWACPLWLWRLIRGKRPYLINRMPHSTHLRLTTSTGFRIVCDNTMQLASTYPRAALAEEFQFLSTEDQITGGALIQAAKPAAAPRA